MTPAIELTSVGKSFGAVRALHDLSLRVPRGGIFGLLGPNGAGKTTLLSLAAGFLRPDIGRVEVLGADATDFARQCGRISLMPQDAAFQARVPLGAQLAHFARLSGVAREHAPAAAQRALAAVRLEGVEGRAPGALSHGMAKRAALAQALLGEPELLLLDEPSAGLDPENARHVRELVSRLAEDCTVVLCSHNLHEIQELCDRVAILQHGRLVEAGPMERLTGQARRVRIGFHDPVATVAARALGSVAAVESAAASDDRTLEVHLHEGAASERTAAVRSLLACLLDHGCIPVELRTGVSLESRFLELTAGGRGEEP